MKIQLDLRVKSRFYGNVSPDEDEERRVQVKKLYLILAGGDGCPGCEAALEEYSKEIAAGDIEVLNAETDDKAIEIVTRLAFYALPALVAEDEDGDYVVIDHTS